MNSILFWGIVPPILLLFYTWRLDRIEREPAGLVIKVFLLGAITTILAVLLESLAALGLSYLDLDESSNLYLLIDNFLAVALIEEFGKRMPVQRSIWRSPEFNYRFDAIVYCLASALGFAATENIVYMISYGTGIALKRLIPVHSICAIYMGHYLGIAKMAEKAGDQKTYKRFRRLSLIIPTLIHGFWDFSLTTENTLFYLAALGMIFILTIVSFNSLHKHSKEDVPV